MSGLEVITSAAELLFSWQAIIALVGGTLLGVAIGVLPGLGPAVGVSLALPLTIGMEQIPAITMLLGIYAGSVYGGSVTAILINTPGTPSSAASCLDGYPMARKGLLGEALGYAAFASVFGGIVSTVILALSAPQLAEWALEFGPSEMFALAVFALTCIASVSTGSIAKGLLTGIFGLFLAVIGQDVFTGETRFNFGVFELSAGLSLVPILVGLFALSEVFTRLASPDIAEAVPDTPTNFRFPGVSAIKGIWVVLAKSSIIGTFLGILPGIGPTTASFVSYAEARRTSSKPETFGQGNPEGLVASETANNAVTGGALVPTLALGVPGDPITAILLGALVIKDIAPGPSLFIQHGDLVSALFMGLLLVNVILLPIAKYFAAIWRRVLMLPEPLMLSGVTMLIGVGVYTLNNSLLDMATVFTAGVVGYLLRLARFPLAPIIIGFVLGRMIEENLRMGLIVFDNDVSAFFLRPIPLTLYALSVVFVFWPLIAGMFQRRRARKQV